MMKPRKKKEKSQNDDKQSKISSFFGNQPNKKADSKLFTKISAVLPQGTGRLTLVKSRNPEAQTSAEYISKTGPADTIQRTINKQSKGVENAAQDDHVIVIEDDESELCTDIKLKNTDKIVFSNDNTNDTGNVLPNDVGHFSAGEDNKDCETSEPSFVTPRKQDMKINHCDSLECSPDIIFETPGVDSVFRDASERRKKAALSRSFLCPQDLLGVQPGLKPAQLRIKERKGTRNLIGNVSVTFTSNSGSLNNSSEDTEAGQSSVGVVHAVTLGADTTACESDSIINPSTCVETLQRKQISISSDKTFQDECLRKNEIVSENRIGTKERPKISHNDELCIPETQYFDAVNVCKAIDNIEDSEIDDGPCNTTYSDSNKKSLAQKVSSCGATTTAGSENSVRNIFKKTQSGSESSKSLSVETEKSASKLINALEEVDFRAEMTEENLWLGQRLMMHFSDGIPDSVNNIQEPKLHDVNITPVKKHGNLKRVVKRQAKPGSSPLSKRQPRSAFTELKDITQTHDYPTDKELNMLLAQSSNKAKKILCLENIVPAAYEIQQNNSRFTEHRAYQFGLKKKAIHENDDQKVTLENDKHLLDLLRQLKTQSKTDNKFSAQVLQELNPASIFSNTSLERDKASRYVLKQKSTNKSSVLEADVEMLDQLFGNDSLDSEDLEEGEQQGKTNDQECSVLKQDSHSIRDVSQTYINAVIHHKDKSMQEEPIIILDDTQNMNVHSDSIIIEDNSDNCYDNTSTQKIPESHKVTETREDVGHIAVDSITMDVCLKKTLCENLCSNLTGPCSTISKNGDCSVAKDISVLASLELEHSTDIYGQASVIATHSIIPNTENNESLNHRNNSAIASYTIGGVNASSGGTSKDVSAKNSSNVIIENNNLNCAEDNITVTANRHCADTGCDRSIFSSVTIVGSTEYTELSTSICDMLDESFDEDFQDFRKPEIANKDFRFTDLWNRFTVLDVTYNRDESHLRLLCDKTRKVCQCTLRGFWTDTIIGKDDVVNVVGDFSDGVCIIDDRNGLIIVSPDHLLSGTLVVSSTFCARKSVLTEKFKVVDSGVLQMFYGNILHSLFQTVLKDGIRNVQAIMQAAILLLKSSKFLHEMYAHDIQEVSVMKEIDQYIPSLTSWLAKHTETPGRGGRVRLQESEMVVTEIHDIEENIWSPRFGLKGKIDVTVKAKLRKSNSSQEVKVLPLELKTGKASFSHEHKGQVTLYSMMCSDRREDPEEGILLYLKHGQMETVPVKPENKCGLIQLRNNLTHYLTQEVCKQISSDGQVTYQLGQLPQPINNPRSCGQCPQLLNCSIYQRMVDHTVYPENHAMSTLVPQSLQHITESDLSYFTHWMLCLNLEERESKKANLSQIWRASSSQREKNGECLSNLMIASSQLDIPESQCFNEGRGCSLTFSRDTSHQGPALSSVGLVSNDMVVISSEDGRYIALATGFVRRISHNLVEVVVDRDHLHDISAYTNMTFRLDKNNSFSTSGYLYTNLSRLMMSTPRATHLRNLIINLQPPEFDLKLSKACIQKVKAVFKPLNKPQKTAILKVLMSKDYVLIKGFPGTGKTAAIVALVKILRLIGQSVLLTSYTHSAVDNILLKLKEDGVPFLRLGRRSRINPSILSHSAEVLTSTGAINSVQELKHFYDSYDVVATNALGVNHPVFNKRQFDVCIVDEASQVMQPACLGPLFHCSKFVLVGDLKQLPPVVQSKEARKLGLDESLFARLDNIGATYELCLQYRMNRVIMELSNSLVYDGKLQCASLEVAQQCYKLDQSQISDTPSWMKDVLSSQLERSAVFLDTQMILSMEVSSGQGITNEIEADLVVTILKAVVQADVRAHDVGVISPYRSQVKMIKQKVQGCTDIVDIEVNTVDQYQGRDKSIIIVSFVRSQSDNTGELLKDLRRLNVALSRARHKLILIGNAKALKAYQHLAKILSRLEETKNIVQIQEV